MARLKAGLKLSMNLNGNGYDNALMASFFLGGIKSQASVLSFVLEGFETTEVDALLNNEGIAVRSGHHCAQPVLRRFRLEATVRPSLAFYNHCGDIDTLLATLIKIQSGRSKL